MKSNFAHAFVWDGTQLVTANCTINAVGDKGFGDYEFAQQVGNFGYTMRGANPKVGDETTDGGRVITLEGVGVLTPLTGHAEGTKLPVYMRVKWTQSLDGKTLKVSGEHFASADAAQASDTIPQAFAVIMGSANIS